MGLWAWGMEREEAVEAAAGLRHRASLCCDLCEERLLLFTPKRSASISVRATLQ
jgi:hypothetical protein